MKPGAHSRAVLGAGALAALALSCVDFSLSEPSDPAIESFARECSADCSAPLSAYAGELLSLSAANLEEAPEANVVYFESASARGEAFADDGALLVTVPDGAGTGKLVLETRQGRSLPSAEAFAYRGLGHPARGAVAATRHVSLLPVGVAAAGGQAYLASGWMQALVDGQGRRLRLDFEPTTLDASPDGTKLIVGGVSNALYAVDLAQWPAVSPEVLVELDMDEAVHVETGRDANGKDVAWVMGLRGDEIVLAIVDLESREVTWGPEMGLAYVEGVRVSSNGAYLVATAGTGTLENLIHMVLVVDLKTLQFHHVPLPDGEVLHRGTLTVTGSRAYVPMVNGRVYLLDLGDEPAWALKDSLSYDTLDTFYGLVVGGMAVVAGGAGAEGTLLAQIPGEGRLVAVDLVERSRVWSAPTSEETLIRFALDSTAHEVFVANLKSNTVTAVDWSAHAVSDVVSFALGLGSTSDAPAQGAGYDPANHRVLVPARRGRVLVPIDTRSLDVGAPIFLDDRVSISAPRAVQVSPKGKVWVLHEGHLGALESENGIEEEAIQFALPGLGQRLAFVGDDADTVLVGMNDRVVAVRNGQLVPGPVFPGGFLELLETRGESALVVWSQQIGQYDRPLAGVFPLSDLTSRTELALQSPEGEFLGALTVLGRPWLFYSPEAAEGGTATPQADGLQGWDGSAFQVSPRVGSSVDDIGPVAATPDGRRFVWTGLIEDDGVARFTAMGAGGTFENTSITSLPGPLCGVAFSEDGERAFVPICSGDDVAVIE